MISTDKVKQNIDDQDKKLKILTTTKYKPKTIAEPDERKQGKKLGNRMLTTANMGDRAMNEKRKKLMAERKRLEVNAIKAKNIIATPLTNTVEVESIIKKKPGRPKKKS